MSRPPTIILFGYDSSPFTQKIRLSLAIRRLPYTFVLVPSMMPRPVLVDLFNLTYRKIPVLAIDNDVYIDTSLILEALATHPSLPPPSSQNPALHPDKRTRTLTRILSSHYTDRPLFRFTTGLIPQSVWSSSFGVDRASLIGHKLDAAKLGAKVPLNLSGLDTFLSIMEPLFTSPPSSSSGSSHSQRWFLDTPTPSAADISLYYQLDWGDKMSRGDGINDLTGGGVPNSNDTSVNAMSQIFNRDRYPGLYGWFEAVRAYFESLPSLETRIERMEYEDKPQDGKVKGKLDELIDEINNHTRSSSSSSIESESKALLLPTPVPTNTALDARVGLQAGVRVSIFPRDTGRANPTVGTILAIGTEEVVITPDGNDGHERGLQVKGVKLHFPRVEFGVVPVVKGAVGAKL